MQCKTKHLFFFFFSIYQKYVVTQILHDREITRNLLAKYKKYIFFFSFSILYPVSTKKFCSKLFMFVFLSFSTLSICVWKFFVALGNFLFSNRFKCVAQTTYLVCALFSVAELKLKLDIYKKILVKNIWNITSKLGISSKPTSSISTKNLS